MKHLIVTLIVLVKLNFTSKIKGDVSNNTHLIHVVLSGPTQLVVHSKNCHSIAPLVQ
jgi:hypothetical protein